MQHKITEQPSTGLAWLALFASGSTLLCCALPILFVSVGMGATVAAMTSSFPILIDLSQHKVWLFGISAFLLIATGWLLWRPGQSCPTDQSAARLCRQTQRWNRVVYWSAVSVWSVGFFAAYVALPLRIWLGW